MTIGPHCIGAANAKLGNLKRRDVTLSPMADQSETLLEDCADTLVQKKPSAEQWVSILRFLCRWVKVKEETLAEGFMRALGDNTQHTKGKLEV